MNRIDAVTAIGDLLEQKCSNCQTRDEFNWKYGSVTSKLDKHCKINCPVGRQLQDYGKQLGRKGDEHGTDYLGRRGKSEAPCGAGQLWLKPPTRS
ncbi:zinc-finger domain-containing protein [Paenibacillus sp. 1-18]|uniref:zinc-finger domain-containing protein n=1 Tax=Paenibacillus sp. 1-18 TaxID=1333846 RepID=UPI0004B4A3F0|nr:zinc-finger domain-containing protein [Paenibacillus sp. 1-18]